MNYLRRSFSVPVAGPSVTQEAWDAIFGRPFKGLHAAIAEASAKAPPDKYIGPIFDDLLSIYRAALEINGPCKYLHTGPDRFTIYDSHGRTVLVCDSGTLFRLLKEARK
jgi:hypothetical protein